MSSLLDKARELRRRLRETGDTGKGGLSARLYLDLIEFFEMVEEKEEAASIGMQPANIPQLTIPLYPDPKAEARERRTLAIAQIAAVLQADMDYVEAVRLARAILAEVEKQEAEK